MFFVFLLAVLGLGVGFVLAEFGARKIDQHRRMEKRIAIFIRGEHLQPDAPEKAGDSLFVGIAAKIGQSLIKRGFLPDKTLDELRRTLSDSGIKGQAAVSIFVGAKIMAMIILTIVFWLCFSRQPWMPHPLKYTFPLFGLVLGMILPDKLILSRRKEWAGKLEKGLPDALDIMVICTRAGSSVMTSMSQAAAEMQDMNPEIAGELKMVVDEMAVSSDVRVALGNMATRSGVNGMKRLAMTLLQSARYGTPTADALSGLAGEMRLEALTRYEAGAARLGVLLTMPTVCFIMPCVFIVAGGPAGVQIYRSFFHH